VSTITITVDTELVEAFRVARDARRARGEVWADDEPHDDEMRSAHLLALHVANMAAGE